MLEGGETLRVRSDDVHAFDLAVGLGVSNPVLGRLRARAAVARAAEQAYRLLSLRMRSRRELESRLRRYGYSEDIIGDVLGELERARLIDDERFAAAWVRGRMALRPSGAALLRRELFQKGVAREVVDRTVREALGGQIEETLARTVAQARARTYQRLPYQVAYRRLAGLLQRRGFAPGVIAAVLRETLGASPQPAAD